MKRIVFLSILIVLTGIGIVACNHKKGVDPTSPTGPDSTHTTPVDSTAVIDTTGSSTTLNPADTALCFGRDILPIFITSCARSGCHDVATHEEGYTFTTYATITAKKFYPGNAAKCKIYKVITAHSGSGGDDDHKDSHKTTDDDDIMPPLPNAPLTAGQIALIARWINEGADSSTNCASPCDSNNFAFAANVQPIINTYCKSCHSLATPSGGVLLDGYTGIHAVAVNGKLMGSINHDAGYVPMPQGGLVLSICQVVQIRKWVEAGAVKN